MPPAGARFNVIEVLCLVGDRRHSEQRRSRAHKTGGSDSGSIPDRQPVLGRRGSTSAFLTQLFVRAL